MMIKNKFLVGYIIGCIAMITMILCGDHVILPSIKNHEYNQYKIQYSWLTMRIYDKVNFEAGKNKIDPKIIFAIINSESHGNQYAYSQAGAIGLMQIMPYHLPKGIKSKYALYDFDLNIEVGCKVFADCLDNSRGNVIKGINAYERGKKKEVSIDYLGEIFENLNYRKRYAK